MGGISVTRVGGAGFVDGNRRGTVGRIGVALAGRVELLLGSGATSAMGGAGFDSG